MPKSNNCWLLLCVVFRTVGRWWCERPRIGPRPILGVGGRLPRQVGPPITKVLIVAMTALNLLYAYKHEQHPHMPSNVCPLKRANVVPRWLSPSLTISVSPQAALSHGPNVVALK